MTTLTMKPIPPAATAANPDLNADGALLQRLGLKTSHRVPTP